MIGCEEPQGDAYEEESFQLHIDESHSPSREESTTVFVATEDEQSTLFPSMGCERPMEFGQGGPDNNRPNNLFHLSRNQHLCVDVQREGSKEDEEVEGEETPIVRMEDGEEQEHQHDGCCGEPHMEEYGEVTYEDGRLSMYDDEPTETNGFVEYEETENSDMSDFGAEVSRRSGMVAEERTSSEYSDVTPDAIDLNKFTPLNTTTVGDGEISGEFCAQQQEMEDVDVTNGHPEPFVAPIDEVKTGGMPER